MSTSSKYAVEAIGQAPSEWAWRPSNRISERFAYRSDDLFVEESLGSSALPPVLIFGVSTNWLPKATMRVAELSKLDDNWDGYDAPRPLQHAIRTCLRALSVLAEMEFEPWSIDASAEGGVCISFRASDRYGDIEFFNSGEVLAVTSTGQNDSTVWEVANGEHALRAAAEKIRTFIDQ